MRVQHARTTCAYNMRVQHTRVDRYMTRCCFFQDWTGGAHKSTASQQVTPDDHSEVVPLLPIPNRNVKRLCADDSGRTSVKVGHRQAFIPKTPLEQSSGVLPLGRRIAQWLHWLGRPYRGNALSIHDERLPVARSRHTANICLQFTHRNASGIDHRAANSKQQTANSKQKQQQQAASSKQQTANSKGRVAPIRAL